VRTTLKRGVGRGADMNGNGHAVFPPSPISPIIRYRQPPPPARTGLALLRRILLVVVLAVLALVSGAAGGAYLWFHQSVNAVRAHSPAMKVAQRELDVTPPGRATTALLLGNNQRAGFERNAGGRSDTIMLIRADPQTNTISLLSIPRDLRVPIYCPRSRQPLETTRVDDAFAYCGPAGSLDTVKHLTGVPVNYLITIEYHGFKEIVNDFGGVWLDIDRRYYNPPGDGYAAIDLQPGYQLLSGGSALDFVRFRHTDNDFYRQAREQEFLRALKQELSQHFDPLKLLQIVSAITHNVEVGGKFDGSTVLRYALFAIGLQSGHIIQNYVANTADVNVGGADELTAPTTSIQQAVQHFENPDVGQAKAANAVALGEKLKSSTPTPQQTSITVLNGNGVAGAAANAAYLLAQRRYVLLQPPHGLAPNAPLQDYFHTKVYFRPAQPRTKAAALALQKLLQPADVQPLPPEPGLRRLDPGASLLVVTGQTFQNALTAIAPSGAPARQPPYVRVDGGPGLQLLRPLVKRVPFPLELPTVLERNSYPDSCCGDVPARVYSITKGQKAIRLVFRTGGNEYWGIEETSWTAAPILGDRSFLHDLGGREWDLYYSGSHLHMAVLHANGASYWVVNTLLDSLSNETMLAIAKGLRPLRTAA
jgi:LCP family protein required for cell wall assembly